MTKLQVWNLTQFDRVVYLDPDIVVTRNVDELFEVRHTAPCMSLLSRPLVN